MHLVDITKEDMHWKPQDEQKRHASMNEDDVRDEDQHFLLEHASPPSVTRRAECAAIIKRSKPLIILVSILCCLLVTLTIMVFHLQKELSLRPPRLSPLGLRNRKDLTRVIGLPNRFKNGDSLWPENEAWAGIDGAGHGIVALTPEFVATHNLQDTIQHPLDPSKRVYALEAYHMMHCLERLRKDYLALRDGKIPDKPLEHDLHCFDALRQSIMCHASDELLIITGHGHARGYNQTVQCRDWDELREFATKHTACYSDEPPAWDKCDDGTDGLPVGSLLD